MSDTTAELRRLDAEQDFIVAIRRLRLAADTAHRLAIQTGAPATQVGLLLNIDYLAGIAWHADALHRHNQPT